MKYLLLLILLPFTCFSQDKYDISMLPVKKGQLLYEAVVSVEGKTKAEIYNKAKYSLVRLFKSAKDVIQNEDKEAGKIIGKGYDDVYYSTKVMGMKINNQIKMNFLIDISIKDGRYRVQLYDHVCSTYVPATHSWVSGTINSEVIEPGKSKRVSYDYLIAIHKANTAIIEEFKQLMTDAEAPNTDDW